MKTNAIVRIVIWSVVIVALVGVMALGLFPWLIQDTFFDNGPPAETAIPVPLETEAVMLPLQPLPNEGELRLNPDSIQEIEIEWVAGDIVILAMDTENISISESDVTNEQYSMIFKTEGKKLEIQFCKDLLMPELGINLSDNLKKDLYIEVPRGWTGHSIEIDTADSNVEMHDITLTKLDIDSADGTCDFQNCNIGDLDIDTADGDIYYLGTLDTLDFDAASASFTGELLNTPSRIDMDSMDGKLDLALPEDCGFTLSMDGVSSQLSSDFNGTSTKNGSYIYGDGRCRINVDGMLCDVTLRKLEAK